jgi:hypothetical protein
MDDNNTKTSIWDSLTENMRTWTVLMVFLVIALSLKGFFVNSFHRSKFLIFRPVCRTTSLPTASFLSLFRQMPVVPIPNCLQPNWVAIVVEGVWTQQEHQQIEFQWQILLVKLHLHHIKRCVDSTQDKAKQILNNKDISHISNVVSDNNNHKSNNINHNQHLRQHIVIIADGQHYGRGTSGQAWVGLPGNLYMMYCIVPMNDTASWDRRCCFWSIITGVVMSPTWWCWLWLWWHEQYLRRECEMAKWCFNW